MGCQTLSKCTKVTLHAPCILYTEGGGPGTAPPPSSVRRPLCPGGGWRDGCRDLEWKIDGRDKRGWQIIFLWLWYFLICIFAIVTLVCVSKIFYNGKRTWQKSVCLKKEILLFWLVRTNSFSHISLMNPPSPARSCTCCTGLGTWLASDRSLNIVQYILNHITMDYFKTMEYYILLDKVHFLVNLKSCLARVLNWAIQENIRPVELAEYRIFMPALLSVYFPVLPRWWLWHVSSENSTEGVPPQWFSLVPSTRFGPILRENNSVARYFFLVRARAKTKIVLKHKLPNNDYRRCPRWQIKLELHQKKYFSKRNWKKPFKN